MLADSMKEGETENQGLILDVCLLIVPWMFFAWMIIWSKYIGPEWPFGDKALYDSGIGVQVVGFGMGLPVLAIVRYWIHRRRLILSALTAGSGIAFWIFAPGLA